MCDARTSRGAVIGVGNALMTDDGIGEAILAELDRPDLPSNVDLINAGGDPLRVLQDLDAVDFALVIDAADMRLEPGDVRVFGCEELAASLLAEGRPAHAVDVSGVLRLARMLGLSRKLRFLAVQTASVAPGQGLSAAVRSRWPGLVQRVHEELARLIQDSRRAN